MSILLSNDDGIDAPGLAALADALSGLDDIYVSAPSGNRSGAGMAVTIGRDITPRAYPDGPGGFKRVAVDGTPTDAMKYGLQFLVPDRPRLVASGINHGPNLGRNVRCSGTVGAAMEGLLWGIPALAASVDCVERPDWSGAKHYARLVAERILAAGDAFQPVLLNLNVPALPPEAIRGFALVRHGTGGFNEYFVSGGSGGAFQLGGEWLDTPLGECCDAAAINRGYAVLTPMRFDMTDVQALDRLRGDWDDLFCDL
ncbi:MAG: 5'/3'-nucleotidase SurE [Planctomycetota bacterium]|jgi:5'-nucleotidase|nr:5'/3'-nucleotidase SurE [Planctomycetota bacterium]